MQQDITGINRYKTVQFRMQQNHTLKTASTEMHSATTSITFFKLLHSVASGMVRVKAYLVHKLLTVPNVLRSCSTGHAVIFEKNGSWPWSISSSEWKQTNLTALSLFPEMSWNFHRLVSIMGYTSSFLWSIDAFIDITMVYTPWDMWVRLSLQTAGPCLSSSCRQWQITHAFCTKSPFIVQYILLKRS